MKTKRELIACSVAILCILLQSFCCSPSFAAETAVTVESPKTCKHCGMDRTEFARSRMLIVYEDGTTVGVCSIHCAATDLKQNTGKHVKSLMVADYNTKQLIDARTALWVFGGNKPGGMNSPAKWAFSSEADARSFINKNGGTLISFDEAMKSAEGEIGKGGGMTHGHHSHMGPTAQMLYNPGFGDDIYHTHPAGMWMATYKFMRMNMGGLRAGTTNVDQSSVGFMRGKPYNYMMIPTGMTMDMHMFMVMYGVTDRLTMMAMANYQTSDMSMLMDMGPGRMITTEPPMSVGGFGDTEIRGMYKINGNLVGSLGLSLPTGSIDKEFDTMHMTFRSPYDMQLGSGTYDLKPALTYSVFMGDGKWNWGAQAMYTLRLGKNDNDWSFGNNLKVTSWLQRAFGPLTSWMRLAYNNTGRISGEDMEIRKLNHPMMGMGAPMPDADPDNYGGQRLDGLIGISLTRGALSFGVEGGIPLYQNLNGLQMKTKWILNTGVQIMF